MKLDGNQYQNLGMEVAEVNFPNIGIVTYAGPKAASTDLARSWRKSLITVPMRKTGEANLYIFTGFIRKTAVANVCGHLFSSQTISRLTAITRPPL
jgi:hypothetical protein